MDLPAPWEAVASAKKAFKQDKIGKICTFSPCIEQISRTVTALSDNGFVDIQMYECLIRFNEIRVIPMWTIEEAMEKQRAIEKKRKRALPRVLREAADSEQEEEAKKAKIESADDSNTSSAVGTPSSTTGSEEEGAVKSETTPSVPSTPLSSEASPSTSSDPRDRIDPKNVMVTRLPVEQRGHTSYLLFATFTPATQPPNLTQQNAKKA